MKVLAFEQSEVLKIWSAVLSVLNFEVFSVDGNGVSFGKIIVGLVLFVLGTFLSRKAAAHVDRRFLSRFDMQPTVRYNLRSLIFYIFLAFVTLFVLRLLNIPLTVFAVLGGALAIGIGFGSQNIVNNFISGLILMGEQPIRVGDYIEADTFAGTVEQIGARSTRVRSIANTRYVVPNSYFLEKIINNWTLEGRMIRYKIAVIAAHAHDSRDVAQLLEKIISECQDICRTPPPDVNFVDFTETGLKYEVAYSAYMDGTKPPVKISSELRHKIYEEFEKAEVSFGKRN